MRKEIGPMSEPIGLDRIEMFAFGLDHSEGIAVTPEGVIFVGGEAGQIYRIEPDDSFTEIANTGGQMTLGLAADGASRIYAIDSVANCVWRITPDGADGAELEVYTDGLPDRPFHEPNWGAFDAFGNYYLTNSGDHDERNGLIWKIKPGGAAEVWTEEAANFPNGCAVAPDGSCLYYVESFPSAIAAIPIEDDGSAGPRQSLVELGLMVPDGIAIAEDDALIIACYRPDAIFRWHADEGLSTVAFDPQGVHLSAPTNVVFTGPDRGTLVVPNLAGWHLARGDFGITGTPLFYPSADLLG